jgi:hypothetical protein
MSSTDRPLDHDAVLDALDIAAAEPGGLARLVAAKTAEDRAVAEHLAACDACAAELDRLVRVDGALRVGIGPGPSPDLRARTLAFVAEVGVDRGAAPAAASVTSGPAPVPAPGPVAAPPTVPIPIGAVPSARRRSPGPALWVASLVAAVVIAVAGTAFVVGTSAQRTLDAERAQHAAAVAAAESAVGLVIAPTTIRIPMSSPSSAAQGLVLIDPGDLRTAVVAAGLPEAPAGSEYACYVVVDGARVLVGRMTDRGGTYAWIGTMDALEGVPGASIGEYGVVLVPAGSPSVDGTPVLSGSL